ncbi:hypothetical protein TNCV_1134671 [Trichonephila clavipes]|nr:hypothetical protein TNCV_1134671 [Trichonephila clavipes]
MCLTNTGYRFVRWNCVPVDPGRSRLFNYGCGLRCRCCPMTSFSCSFGERSGALAGQAITGSKTETALIVEHNTSPLHSPTISREPSMKLQRSVVWSE